jgi:atlastin
MSDTDDSGVMVEHETKTGDHSAPAVVVSDDEVEALTVDEKIDSSPGKEEDDDAAATDDEAKPQALQIVSIGSEKDAYAFKFEEEKLQAILSRVPVGWDVSIVSVVGAFRTGKSFLLSWFLRYLYQVQADQKSDATNTEPWYERIESLGNEGFEWKAGSDRNTTGIWMWSHPHFIETGKEHPTAVLLVDTQGMFDHETTMSLTASIFGFSTLLSSYQIYNVDKRIQEDNLQQLALFSEYARTAVNDGIEESKKEGDDNDLPKPFQKIEFLVRDWQHFEDEEDDEDCEAMEKSMEKYLQTAIADRDAKDLQDTRQQILSCFANVTCYGLCHPGLAVTKKKFSGDVESIQPLFMHLLDRYCKRVFSPDNLEAKVIHGRTLSAAELGSYIQAYADMFASGAKFPTAATLLEATASANNTNAVHLAVTAYKEEMDRIAGPRCSNYVRPEELQEEHGMIRSKALTVFESVATFGSRNSIDQAKGKFLDQVEDNFQVYESLNTGRNPLAGMET